MSIISKIFKSSLKKLNFRCVKLVLKNKKEKRKVEKSLIFKYKIITIKLKEIHISKMN